MAFAWDDANLGHIDRHRIEPEEVEEAVTDPERVPIQAHRGAGERRRAVIDATDTGRVLFVVFTMRQGRVRVVTARDAEQDERRLYYGG